MARTTIVAIEKGDRRITPAELIKLAGLYRRPVSEFVGCQTITEGFVAQFRWTERQALEENSQYEASVFHLQQRAEDYVELRNRIHREFEGEFAELEIDLAQPLGGR